MSQTLYLIDTTNLMYQFWYKTPKDELNEQGELVNVVNALKLFTHHLLNNEQAKCLVFVFDQRLKTSKRKAISDEYKQHRKGTPEALEKQFVWCQEWIKQQNIAQASSAEVEADDVIATIMKQNRDHFDSMIIISSDKDLYQLIEDKDVCWDLQKDIRLTKKDIIKKTGVQPKQIADQLALAGDKSDNIKGIPGVGLHSAAKLLIKFGSIEGIVEQRDKIKDMKFRNAFFVHQQVNQFYQRLETNKQLTRLYDDVTGFEGLSLCRN